MVGILFGEIQGRLPDKVKGVFGCNSKIFSIKTSTLLKSAQNSLGYIERLFKSQSEPEFNLNKHCDICEFYRICYEKSQKADDLSLLRGMSRAEIKKQRSRGIFTVTQYSYTFRPKKRRKRAKNFRPKRYYSLQARAIREQKVHVFQKPILSLEPVQIYMDVEGLPDEGYNYLIGMLVIETIENAPNETANIPDDICRSWENLIDNVKRSKKYLNPKKSEKLTLIDTGTWSACIYWLWGDKQDQEKGLFEKFLQIVAQYRHFRLIHFGSYENRFIKKMYKLSSAKDKRKINRIIENSTDVLSLIYPSVYFPTYSNRLKEIGAFIGHKWSSDNASGIQSVIWRKKWEISSSDTIRNELLVYNIEDCLCVMKIFYFLLTLLSPDVCRESGVIYTDDLKPEVAGRVWGKAEFGLPDLEFVTKAAYFDYQSEKISLRANRKVKNPRRKPRSSRRYRINKRLLVRCRKCPYCKSSQILPSLDGRKTKMIFDIRFSKTGLKTWIVEYSAENYACQKCNREFYSPRMRYLKKYSHNLKAWVVYQYVANNLSLEFIERYIYDIFDLRISFHSVNRMKTQLAHYYQTTYRKIIKRVIAANVIHIDETRIKLQKETGYVWVFTSPDEVFFLFRESREGKFLVRYLRSFTGVLVSDFYAAYDSLPCEQQKCLVHLVRDMNQDLLKHPYDDEMRLVTKEFGALLRSIVETIDRFGLKNRFLKKHEKEVVKFYRFVLETEFSSDLVKHYQKRFAKNTNKLFVFLKHDGVPWNNNVAENAIRHLAKWRRLVSGRITKTGIEQYCIFLTIYVSCKLRNISFLDFLLSGKRDLDRF
jgi:predicted RecB family nuclease